MKSNLLQILGKDLQLLIFSYLNAIDLINLCYVSKYYRKLILKKFDKYFNLSTGFCSIYSWMNTFEDNIYGLIKNIFNELNDYIDFDFELNCDNLFKEFRHLSLFSACLHFLRCRRSCEKNVVSYCRICSRVRDNAFYEFNAFLSVKLGEEDGYLINCLESVDLDVFLSQPGYFPYAFCESDTCTHHEVFNYTHDLLRAFCSILVRMYLNITMNFFFKSDF